MNPRNRVRLLCAFIMLRLTLVTFVSAVAPQPASTSPQDAAFDVEGKPLPGTTIPCAPIVEKRQELGCYVVGRPKLGALPMQTPLSWHLDNFPNRTSAEMAKNQYGIIVEAFDRVWLFTIAPEDWRAAGAKHVATVGPLALDPKVSEYTALYVATTFRPGLSSSCAGIPARKPGSS